METEYGFNIRHAEFETLRYSLAINNCLLVYGVCIDHSSTCWFWPVNFALFPYSYLCSFI